MLKNLNLATKLNILLILLFLATVLTSGYFLSLALKRTVEQAVIAKALLLIETMGSVREYTSSQINPLLAARLETDNYFLPQTVPGYSAREVFEGLRKRPDYRDFFYKEATLNPTNLRDKADDFEAQLIKNFRTNINLKEATGFREVTREKLFYIARPIVVNQISCLRCHGNPSDAPKSQLVTYGSENGFGWKLNETVGVKMVSVPARQIFQAANDLLLKVIGILGFFLLLAIATLNYFLKSTVTHPLQEMSKLARKLSTGNFDVDFVQSNNDEIGLLANSLNRMKNSLRIMMDMLMGDGEDKTPGSPSRDPNPSQSCEDVFSPDKVGD